MTTSNGVFKHVGNVIATMTKRPQIKDLYQEVIEEMETEHLRVLIRSAFVRGNYLIVTNKAGREIRVPFDQVPALRINLKFRDRLNFVIEPDGSCLYWAAADIHLDFEALLYCIDEEFCNHCNTRKTRHQKEYGKAIAIVRIAYQVPVDGITGIKSEDVQDIESGYLHPEIAALTCYADALGLEINEFLDKVASNVDLLKVML
jgi:hypothetical protein